MLDLIKNIQINVNDKIYLKDPVLTHLGRYIVKESINLIDEIGLEEFTFKKLAQKVGSTESSIYRYFCNKHRILLYLMSWYWGWLEYKLVFSINNISDPAEKLKSSISVLADELEDIELNGMINLKALSRIAIAESAKSYLTKEVDNENKEGLFSSYKNLCKRLSNICDEINPEYKYSKSLASTIYEGIHHQKFCAHHFHSLTDFSSDNLGFKEYFINLALDNLRSDRNGRN
ncbi:MAG: TetR/AcrR family transcriptional regulator [Candidatus Kapabacteria bacterium]|nr:TetR/AcrR family transcriptional regulator [Ignavibacteriota bacterium]MCW5885108.1 TetR/AcrR family transcriptional regulator [Candidatus Kapabacteria bacterium]